jgi:hypothetical protein
MNLSTVPSFLFISKKLRLLSSHTLRRFGGLQPLCGRGVTSSIEVMRNPADCSAAMADSLPEPGPLTLISTSRTPLRIAAAAARWAACWAAKGVLFREPLKPAQPVELVHIVSPSSSVTVINVLLKVAFIWTMARTTFLLIFFFEVFAIINPVLPSLHRAANLFCASYQQTQPAAYRCSLTPFFPATVFLGPFLVRALLWVC